MGVSVTRSVLTAEDIQEKAPAGVTPDITEQDDKVEVPYTDYKAKHHKPYTVDYFKLGDMWDDPDGGYEEEITTIENYFKDRIENGDIANTNSAVKAELRKIEKIHNLKDDERLPVKIGIIKAYIQFLDEENKVKRNYKKYGTR